MTLDEKRIAIAKVCGWTKCHSFVGEYDKHGRIGKVFGNHPIEQVSREIPDYFNNLNAMYEAEKFLKSEVMNVRYWSFLKEIVAKGYNVPIEDIQEEDMFHISASQRAEAFGLAYWLWENK